MNGALSHPLRIVIARARVIRGNFTTKSCLKNSLTKKRVIARGINLSDPSAKKSNIIIT
jgi:hypothetical protein